MTVWFAGSSIGITIHVFGPETHMTAIVSMALGKREIPSNPKALTTTANFLLPGDSVHYGQAVRMVWVADRGGGVGWGVVGALPLTVGIFIGIKKWHFIISL